MTDNQIKSLMALLERIANALEAQAGMPLQSLIPPTPAHETVAALMLAPSPVDQAQYHQHSVSGPALATAIPYDTVRQAMLKFQDARGAHAAQTVLKSFGVKYIMELKAMPERYGDVLAALQ
jgi:hypothetical protein